MVEFFEGIKEGFQGFVQALIDFLPTSPIVFIEANAEVKKYLGMLNWFIPIYTMIAMVEAWLVAISIYYLVVVILRWLKIVD